MPSQGRDQFASRDALLHFIDHNNMLVQTVDEPTRNDNTLEIFLTKNERAIRNIEVQETKLSDHDLVSVDLQYNCI